MKNNSQQKDNSQKHLRPPVVVVLGHVDHGKSSLLEAVKDLKITEKEAGGITQHIGAYVVSHKGEDITFIDTPGHEAFFAMRSRGTKVADVGILVVAADESIKEQTKEAIKHLKEEGTPFLVAINKIDKRNIDIERVKQDLSTEEVFLESYGGSVPSVNVSAKEKTGIEDLLEIITLLAEMEEIEDKKTEQTEGVVIEAKRDPRKGVVVTFLVKEGVLKKGDIVATKCSYGKIRRMENFLGEELPEAGPSVPVQVTGIKGCPEAGEEFYVFKKLEEARTFGLEDKVKKDTSLLSEGKKALNIIIKADVMGSLEAIESSLEKIPQSEVCIKIIRADVGNITESDIECSKTAKAKIFGFRIKPDGVVEKMALRENVEIYYSDIIYELIEKVKEYAQEMLEEEVIRTETGKIKILAVFRTQKNRQILGGKVMNGEAKKGIVEIWRDEKLVGEGKLINIKKEEKDMERIPEGEEFGMLLESKEKAEEGDVLMLYKEEKIKRKL